MSVKVFKIKTALLLLSFFIILSATFNNAITRNNYPNLINYKFNPQDSYTSSVCFADMGSWMGINLPNKTQMGINGPYILNEQKWVAKSLAVFKILALDSTDISPHENFKTESYPGLFILSVENDKLKITIKSFFVSSETLVNQIEIKNLSSDKFDFIPKFISDLFSHVKIAKNSPNEFETKLGKIKLNFSLKNLTREIINDSSYIYLGKIESIKKKSSTVFSYSVSYLTNDELAKSSFTNIDFKQSEKLLESNTKRWNKYILNIVRDDIKEFDFVPIKSLQTLITNWKVPIGALKHQGIVPSMSVSYFYGFWAWDSWKHAVALSKFAPELAKDQILTMFDYQDSSGMIADCIFPDPSENNLRDTKPPLASWAVWEVYLVTKDKKFLKKMFPLLEKYHKWWYQNRDYNKNGLCEYGSTDGTLIAAKWESGMDNAVRFDESKLLKNNTSAWSLNQESVDLNCYLYDEKIKLKMIAEILGEKSKAQNYLNDANNLKKLISNTFYNSEQGYYYDKIIDSTLISVAGPEGWIPLWSKVASEEQAKKVVSFMMQKNNFNSFIPFSTLSPNHSEFSIDGYWRGPVWLDQHYFALKGLRNYGFVNKADSITRLVFNRLEGLNTNGPIFENYDPNTGKGLNAPNFSWSAAHLLMMYWEIGKR